MKVFLSRERKCEYETQISPPSTLRSAGFEEPATRDAENTQNNPTQQASPSPELQPANEPPHRHFPSMLQKRYAKEKKSGASAPFSSDPIFSSPHLQQRFIENRGS
ncbi:MAG TPA: hypothetical protein VF427_10615 [Noviherbaspirillum sp.]